MSTLAPMLGYRPFPSIDASDLMDRAFSGSALGPEWPQQNLVAADDDHYRIVLAVPGFRDDDLEIVAEPNRLTIAGRPPEEAQEGQVVYRGIAVQPFRRTYQLADHVRVENARLEEGLLKIDLVRDVPEGLRPKRIQISGSGQAAIEQSTAH